MWDVAKWDSGITGTNRVVGMVGKIGIGDKGSQMALYPKILYFTLKISKSYIETAV